MFQDPQLKLLQKRETKYIIMIKLNMLSRKQKIQISRELLLELEGNDVFYKLN